VVDTELRLALVKEAMLLLDCYDAVVSASIASKKDRGLSVEDLRAMAISIYIQTKRR
jgi:hypothetical protein